MSSCFSGGGRSYVFELDIVKSPSSSTRTSQTSSSPSSTLSESSNSALAISTRKARTPRKRPNQTYNEAAALLSIAYPNIFTTTKILPSSRRSSSSAASKPYDSFLDPSSSSELLLPFRVINDNNNNNKKPDSRWSPSSKAAAVNSPGEFNSPVNLDDCCSMELCNGYQDEDDFDAESMLDEEVEEGIDSIMGTTSTSSTGLSETDQNMLPNLCYGYPMGLGFGGNFELGFGIRRGGVRPLRQVDDGWSFPTVDVLEISPRFNKSRPSVPTGKKKKKKKKMEKLTVVESKLAELPAKEEDKSPEGSDSDAEPGALMLRLDYDEVLSAWSDKPSPFPEELMGGGAVGNDVSARLAQIDLFTDAGGLREASVMRYKEKRRTRLFSKKIRYQVRKVNADRRPRMKGRFVRRPNSSTNGQRQKEM